MNLKKQKSMATYLQNADFRVPLVENHFVPSTHF